MTNERDHNFKKIHAFSLMTDKAQFKSSETMNQRAKSYTILWVYSFRQLESCKSNSNLLVFNMEISGRFPLSTLKFEKVDAGDILDRFWR